MNFSFFKKRDESVRRIKDLSADEIAQETMKQFQRSGWGSLTGRLLYRGLELDSRHVPLLIGLSAYFNDGPNDKIPTGSGLFSGLILDYALFFKGSLSPGEYKLLEAERTKLLWKWGLAHYRTTGENRVPLNFEDQTQFEIDEINFIKVLVQTKSGKTTKEAFTMAHIGVGLRSGSLIAKKANAQNVSHDPSFYRTSPAYQDWIVQDITALARLLK